MNLQFYGEICWACPKTDGYALRKEFIDNGYIIVMITDKLNLNFGLAIDR